ncbi:hypothetical protein EJ05DRAFT_284 [Pseudovirgaria hyperparasitica]|uniref:Uncharacterized protein n=1 Tax=Pseudovirgaria hyperparasitica TaxID=470096 RepID=A0A6A6WJL3_9PEZI|nr:uncharacterized protein EJ05DRAFT_284 [Pseudovirgaria hyperparasitica]KAF2762400.1 hypothetical protein EJ05DRAFT_284 [Pseudovirgaria hyperparasitica]
MLGKKEDSQSNEDEATMNENIFVTSLGEDDGGEEKAHKVLQAVQRTDALHLDTVWHFFLDEKPKQAPSFPSNHLSQVWTSPSMTSLSSRRDLFLSGFVSTWAGMQELPNEVLLWILYDLCSNADTDLQEAYVRVLRESEIQLRDLLTIDRIKDLFASLKSKSEALDIRMVMQPSKEVPRSVQVPLPPGLLPLLTLFKQAASLLTQETRSYTLFILVRMLYDSSVLSSAATFTLLRSTLGSLIDSSSLSSTLDTDISALTSSLPCALKSVTLQATLITALPALSPAQQTFKRALALSFFLNTPIPGVAHLLSASVAKDVMTCLSTNSLYTAIDDTTDYSTLTASMTLLDVAIDVGFGLPLSASAPGLPGDSTPSLTKDPNVTRFNNDVDALAQRLRTIESCIRDSGATDMARMLAKDAVSGVKFRLEGAVRLGAKRKRGMFAAGDEGQESIKKMFMRPPVPKIEKAE